LSHSSGLCIKKVAFPLWIFREIFGIQPQRYSKIPRQYWFNTLPMGVWNKFEATMQNFFEWPQWKAPIKKGFESTLRI